MLRRFTRSSIAAILLAGCGADPTREELGTTSAELSMSAALSFDNPAHWTVSGGTRAGSSIKTQGTGSIEVNTSYYTELKARNLETPSSVGNAISFDLRINSQLGWGEVRVVLVSQTLNLWTEVGRVQVNTLAPNQFHRRQFPLSSTLRQQLSQSYSDLEFRIIFDAPPARYWVDNGSFGGGTASSCSDGIQNGRETDVDCGGACAPCGAAVSGILWYDKFTNGLGQWTASAFSTAALAHENDYAEPGSGSPAATASATATLTSPVINLSGAQGVPLLSFHRLISAPAGSATRLEIKQGSTWQSVRDLAANGANDNRWRTEFVPLGQYIGSTSFQFRFVTSGTGMNFQVDDVSITDRSKVDGVYRAQSFVMPPNVLSCSQTWQWRIDQAEPWNPAVCGPFGNNGVWPLTQPEANPADIWLRTTLSIGSSENRNNLRFWARWDDELEIRVNGVLVVDRDSWTPSYRYLVPSTNAFVVGTNTIEVHARDTGGERYVDVGLSRDVAPNMPETVSPPAYAHGGTHPLAGFANLLHEYVLSRHAPGLAFSLYKDGQRILDAAYGYRDAALTQPMPLNPVMRLASVDKPFSAAAAVKLINDGFVLASGQPLTRNTLVFPTLRSHYGFAASASQAGQFVDQITVGHLIDHTSHVREIHEGGAGDFYSVIGVSPGHTTRRDNARYVHNAGCTAQPGIGEEYSSAGYMLLRYFIDEIVPGGLLSYLHGAIHPEIFIDHESLLGRHSREPWYATQVPPYDRWINFEHYTGLAASPRAVAELGISRNYVTGIAQPYGGVTSGCEGFNGGMSGSIAYGRQCERGITFGLLFNSHQQSGSYDDLPEIIQNYALSLPDSAYQ